jgi:hypothetical protein
MGVLLDHLIFAMTAQSIAPRSIDLVFGPSSLRALQRRPLLTGSSSLLRAQVVAVMSSTALIKAQTDACREHGVGVTRLGTPCDRLVLSIPYCGVTIGVQVVIHSPPSPPDEDEVRRRFVQDAASLGSPCVHLHVLIHAVMLHETSYFWGSLSQHRDLRALFCPPQGKVPYPDIIPLDLGGDEDSQVRLLSR